MAGWTGVQGQEAIDGKSSEDIGILMTAGGEKKQQQQELL